MLTIEVFLSPFNKSQRIFAHESLREWYVLKSGESISRYLRRDCLIAVFNGNQRKIQQAALI